MLTVLFDLLNFIGMNKLTVVTHFFSCHFNVLITAVKPAPVLFQLHAEFCFPVAVVAPVRKLALFIIIPVFEFTHFQPLLIALPQPLI